MLPTSAVWSASWNISNYFIIKQIWKHVAETKFEIPADNERKYFVKFASNTVCGIQSH